MGTPRKYERITYASCRSTTGATIERLPLINRLEFLNYSDTITMIPIKCVVFFSHLRREVNQFSGHILAIFVLNRYP